MSRCEEGKEGKSIERRKKRMQWTLDYHGREGKLATGGGKKGKKGRKGKKGHYWQGRKNKDIINIDKT